MFGASLVHLDSEFQTTYNLILAYLAVYAILNLKPFAPGI